MQGKAEKENVFDFIFQVVKLIPRGKVTSYGAIASYIGVKGGARMVGYALNSSHGIAGLPAHRVVNRNGMLTGKHHFENPHKMQELLEAEDIVVQADKIINFEAIFWNPTKKLKV